MSNPNIKPGEMEDIVPEEVSAVETPAVPEAGFVVLNKSETPEPESTEPEPFPLSPDPVAKALETLDVMEPEVDVVAKALVALKENIDALSDIQKGLLVDLAIAVAPSEEQTVEKADMKPCEDCESETCKGECSKSCKGTMEKGSEDKLGEAIAKMSGLLEQLIQKQAASPLSEDEILAKAEEVKLRKAKEMESESDRVLNSRIDEVAGQVALLTKALGRACGQDT